MIMAEQRVLTARGDGGKLAKGRTGSMVHMGG